ncbi:MAG: hypothetical protein MR579_00365 [Bacteroidales bacterium]|nr:hypothetical protein [Fournierella massiliensis]MCF2556070.1 hypothetical protein [Fournierella massiliensis]MCI6739181.1 hypothetical protein [Bacteroidales bacterium]
MQETIDAVRRAEQAAEELEKQTKQDCAAILEEARAKAGQVRQDRLNQVSAEVAAQKEQAEQTVRQIQDEARQAAQEQVRELEKKASEKQGEAVKRLLKTLL